MDIFRCKDCQKDYREDEIIITVNKDGEWILHCPKCNSDLLSLVDEII